MTMEVFLDLPTTLLGDEYEYLNNELLCYDPQNKTWKNPACYGSVPSPRLDHATAIIGDKVWLYGGGLPEETRISENIFELNMNSLKWTHIITNFAMLCHNQMSLTPISDTQLVLHGGMRWNQLWNDDETPFTLLFNTESQSWQEVASQDNLRECHTGSPGFNGSIIIVGGIVGGDWHRDPYPTNFSVSVMLEPKSLQQLTMQTIYEHRTQLPWKTLPKNLICKLMASQNDKDTEEIHICKIMDPKDESTEIKSDISADDSDDEWTIEDIEIGFA